MLQVAGVIRSRSLKAKPIYSALTPGVHQILAGRLAKVLLNGRLAIRYAKLAKKHFVDGVPYSNFVGDFAANRLMWVGLGPIKARIKKLHIHASRTKHDWRRKNGIGGRSWITTPGQYTMTMIFHDANRAGPHVDVHIGRFSLVYRVKPEVYENLKYNKDGYLTETSKKSLIDMVRSEVKSNARVPQNIDHTVSNAHSTWTFGDREAKHYGAGFTRQVLMQDTVEIYKTGYGMPVEMYAPAIDPHRMQYIYRLYDGKSTGTPICIWGTKSGKHPPFEDRLHLKMVQPERLKDLSEDEISTSTAKYDGSSCYVVITPKGTTVWSPRHSVVTHDRIEYTGKVGDIANTTSEKTIIAMGELLFKEKASKKNGSGGYISAARTSGVLNSNKVTPSHLKPEIRLYRVDRYMGKKVTNIPFWDNRILQHMVADLNPKHLKVVERMDASKAMELGFEGVVTVDPTKSVNEGSKIKWWDDPNDWRIDEVNFKEGPKGGVAGVVVATSLDSGKKFNLGPGQVGDQKLTTHMMNNPENYLGVVMKVNSRRGHEGRAAKVLAFHDDKGFAPQSEL